MFSKDFPVAFSMSGDRTKVAQALTVSSQYNAIIGGAAPNHFIPIPSPPEGCEDKDVLLKDFIVQTLADFDNDEKGTKKKAAEINLATLTYQDMEGMRKSPFFQVCGRPQTKNETSSFNKDMATACVLAEAILREEEYHVSFISFAPDGISASSKSLQTMLRKFLLGEISHSAHTDTNHNMKNGRYQYLIGSNSVKTIGYTLVDTELLKASGVSQDLW